MSDPIKPIYADDLIIQEINQGSVHACTAVRIDFRALKAQERIADALESIALQLVKLANPPLLVRGEPFEEECATQNLKPGGYWQTEQARNSVEAEGGEDVAVRDGPRGPEFAPGEPGRVPPEMRERRRRRQEHEG